MTTPLQLPDVTLCCVDTRSTDLALEAMLKCMAKAQFGDVVLIGPPKWDQVNALPNTVRYVEISPLNGIDAYSTFLIKELGKYITTSHVLIVQWDGFILNPQYWQNDFLSYDYIGSPWYHGGHPGMVGNGGFSLRSKRLLDALTLVSPLANEPEDMAICVTLRQRLENEHAIRFAPLETARAFGCEYGPWREAFGFHGMHNFAHFMSDKELFEWVKRAPTYILTSKHARKLIKELMFNGRAKSAIYLIHKRSNLTGWTRDQFILLARAIIRLTTQRKKIPTRGTG